MTLCTSDDLPKWQALEDHDNMKCQQVRLLSPVQLCWEKMGLNEQIQGGTYGILNR